MKSLVVFYSRDGSTKAVAQKIASELKCAAEEIIDLKNRRGPLGYMFAGRDAMKGKQTEIRGPESNPASFDLIAIGTPIWADALTPAVRTFISKNKGSLKNVAFFCVGGNGKGSSAFAEMESLAGKKPSAVLELSTEEVKKGEFADKLKSFGKEITRI